MFKHSSDKEIVGGFKRYSKERDYHLSKSLGKQDYKFKESLSLFTRMAEDYRVEIIRRNLNEVE